jgi:hypothetical protein
MNLTPDLVIEWSNQISSLQEWTKLFMLVNNSSEDEPTLAANLEAKELFAIRAKAHRTHGKKKTSTIQPPVVLRISPYIRQLAESSIGLDEEDPYSLDSGEALDILQHLDIGLEKATHFMMDLAEEEQTFAKEKNFASQALEHKVGMLMRSRSQTCGLV